MALPQLNTATYELELPSTGETIKYRPFLVKEQKILMLAQESEDDKQIERAFAEIISSCTFEKLSPYEMPLFDIEYIFLMLRGKSIGEKVTLSILCPDDEETRVDVDINLEDVGVLTNDDHTNEIELTKNIKIVMKYPTLSDMGGLSGEGEIFSIFEMIKACIQEIHSDEDIYNSIDISSKELDEFIGNMSTQNFEELGKFFETMPKLQHVIKVKNPKTKKTGEVTIEGMQSFFA
jgi:ribosome-associated translation inhibitor RaiA